MQAPPELDELTCQLVQRATGASAVEPGEVIQQLWSGYGRIQRVHLAGSTTPSAILKLATIGKAGTNHPRGWNSSTAHQRKLRSYRVENAWYSGYARHTDESCRVPALYGEHRENGRQWLLLEDLDAAFPRRCSALSVAQCGVCLDWLAALHARFLFAAGASLWPTGGYWHLATRPDEFEAMAASPMKSAATALDTALAAAQYQSLIHGDAKVANFCFSTDLATTAAVDFQYVGRGAGIRDVAYFLGSCLTEAELDAYDEHLLNRYFSSLATALHNVGHGSLTHAIETEWRALYAVAWADFYRFLLGWMPTHAKITPYTRRLADRAIEQL